jgi:hypothetical protein
MDGVWEREVVGCVQYLLSCPDPQVQGQQQQLQNMGRWSYVAEASEVLAKYDIYATLSHPLPAGTEDVLVLRTKEEHCIAEEIHGEMMWEKCDRKATCKWLSRNRRMNCIAGC